MNEAVGADCSLQLQHSRLCPDVLTYGSGVHNVATDDIPLHDSAPHNHVRLRLC